MKTITFKLSQRRNFQRQPSSTNKAVKTSDRKNISPLKAFIVGKSLEDKT
jgi:hypothetical protein